MSAAVQWRAIAWSSHAKTTVVTDVDGRVQVIAECGGTGAREGQTDEEEIAARRIAALPDLLAACEAYLADRADRGLTCDPVSVRDMRAAVAKAYGRAS